MTIPSSWRQAYGELKDFVARDSEIKISMNMIAIPGDVRPQFYRLFDTVKVAFLEGKFPDLLDEAGTLSRYYAEVEEEVTKLLGLTDISMSDSLNWFLRKPTNSLMRGLFNPLFDLLKGKIDAETFEQGSSRNIESSFKDLYRLGYEKWVALSLVKLLVSDKSFNVTHPELDSGRQDKFQIGREEPVPDPKESKRLSFEHGLFTTFVVPDFIVHSVKINGYVAIKTELGDAYWTASNASERREWYLRKSLQQQNYDLVVLKPDLIVNVDDKPGDIALIADFSRICRPDLIIDCLAQKEWSEKAGLDRIKLCHDILKPRLGTYIVSKEPVPEHVFEKLGGECHLLVVGFDQFRLGSIVDVLKPQTEERMA